MSDHSSEPNNQTSEFAGSKPSINRVLATGATGFVGRNIVRKLLARGYTPVCLVRSQSKLFRQHPDVHPDRLAPVEGSLNDQKSLARAAEGCTAAIHLVGIIIERRLKGQTFQAAHVRGTQNVLNAAAQAGITRYAHMSALGTRENAETAYHRTKWEAEKLVRTSGLDWTIFRPSLIHGPQGKFMQLMRKFMCSPIPPVIPYFGAGQAKLQPVSVKDVAHCFVESLERPETIGKIIPLGGPQTYSWKELYNTCRRLIPGSKRWKPMVSQPVPVAKLMARLMAPPMALGELVMSSLGLLRFDTGQVVMSQEDNVCDHTEAEKLFNIQMRSFEDELAFYADQIR